MLLYPVWYDPFHDRLCELEEVIDILDAQGTYDFTGLTNFGFNLWAVFPDNVVMEINFEQMTIAAVPAPATLVVLAPLAFGRRRRRA